MIGLPDQGSIRARFAGRPYWRLLYGDGHVASEWETDWSLAPEANRQLLRLYCPNGHVAELGDMMGRAISGRCFQFKDAMVSPSGGYSGTLAQIIGLVDSADGWCRWAAWLYDARRLATGRSNIHNFSYEGVPVGTLAFDHLGLKA